MADWWTQGDCTAWLPATLCDHRAILLYLLPSIALAPVLHSLGRMHPLFFIFRLAGTICHELVSASNRKMTINAS